MALVPPTSRASSSAAGVTVLSYVEFTGAVSVTATVEASANTVVTAAAIAADGTTQYCVEFYCAAIITGTGANAAVLIDLFLDGTGIGRIAVTQSATGPDNFPGGVYRRFVTPAVGSRTYSVRAWRSVADGAITASAGGATSAVPGYIRVTSGGQPVALVPPSSHASGGTFNGGTITDPLVIESAVAEVGLTITEPAGAAVDGDTAFFVNGDTGGNVTIDAAGGFVANADTDNTSGHTLMLDGSPYCDIAATGSLLYGPIDTPIGVTLGVTDGVNPPEAALRVTQATGQAPKLGFYGATPVLQQTGVAVNAAGIHAALVSLGLITA